MIIGWYLLYELQLDLCVSGYTIRANGGAYERFTVSIKDMNNGYVIIPYNLCNYASFRDEESWES